VSISADVPQFGHAGRNPSHSDPLDLDHAKSRVGVSVYIQDQAERLDDIAEPIGTLHIAVGGPPVERGRLRRLDLGEVRTAPGVVAVVTAADIPGKTTFRRAAQTSRSSLGRPAEYLEIARPGRSKHDLLARRKKRKGGGDSACRSMLQHRGCPFDGTAAIFHTSTARRMVRSRIGEIPKPTSGAIWCPTFSRVSKALTCR
jgi:hypothetical protein